MMNKEYSTGAVKHSFWLVGFRKVVSFRSKRKPWEEIKELCRTVRSWWNTMGITDRTGRPLKRTYSDSNDWPHIGVS